jgi:AraC-like DNA-binding protein
MFKSTLDISQIEQLRDIPDLTPVTRDYYSDWNIRVFNRETNACKNYLSPNRRDFYKILFVDEGAGIFSIGINTYYIEEPTILFLHPNSIISWKNLSDTSSGYYVLFKKRFIDNHPILKSGIEKYGLFQDTSKNVIRPENDTILSVNKLFAQMLVEELSDSPVTEDAMQAYIQLIMIESIKAANFPEPDMASPDFTQVHNFFQLLEKETSNIGQDNPVRIKTAKEFAASLDMHPNYLNAVLKKHTGQNVSTHIKNRLLEESKVLLVQTQCTLQEIGFMVGFADQPNFSQFFKKNIGLTPHEFRQSYQQ